MSSATNIYSILNKRRTNDVYHTHGTINPKGKYQFDRASLEIFFKSYCDVVSNKDSEKQLFTITEKPQQYLPVLVDIDIKKHIKDDEEVPSLSENLYTIENIENLIESYQNVLRNILNDCNETNLICVVLEKPPYLESKSRNKYFKNGFHLHFPFTFMDKRDQSIHLIPRVKKIADQRKIFSNISFVEKSSSLIDKSVCNNSWLMYGSRKASYMKPYKMTKVYDGNLQEINPTEAFSNYNVYDDNEQIIHFTKEVEYYLPRILSITPSSEDMKMI